MFQWKNGQIVENEEFEKTFNCYCEKVDGSIDKALIDLGFVNWGRYGPIDCEFEVFHDSCRKNLLDNHQFVICVALFDSIDYCCIKNVFDLMDFLAKYLHL